MFAIVPEWISCKVKVSQRGCTSPKQGPEESVRGSFSAGQIQYGNMIGLKLKIYDRDGQIHYGNMIGLKQ